MQSTIDRLTTETGRPAGELVHDALTGYFDETAEIRTALDTRYDEIKNGKVKLIDGEEVFERLRRKSAERRASGS